MDALGCVPGVYHQLRLGRRFSGEVVGVVSDDKNTVVLPEVLERSVLYLQIVFPAFAYIRKYGSL